MSTQPVAPDIKTVVDQRQFQEVAAVVAVAERMQRTAIDEERIAAEIRAKKSGVGIV